MGDDDGSGGGGKGETLRILSLTLEAIPATLTTFRWKEEEE